MKAKQLLTLMKVVLRMIRQELMDIPYKVNDAMARMTGELKVGLTL
jgi:hypothetical protein